MLNAQENIHINIPVDCLARHYDYISKRDGQKKEGYSISVLALVFDEKGTFQSVLALSLGSCQEGDKVLAGDYSLSAPSSYFKKNYVNGSLVYGLSSRFNSDRVTLTPLKK